MANKLLDVRTKRSTLQLEAVENEFLCFFLRCHNATAAVIRLKNVVTSFIGSLIVGVISTSS